MNEQTQQPLVCSHCGTEIRGNAYFRKEAGLYLGSECYFRDTYLDGIVAEIEATYLATIEAFVSAIAAWFYLHKSACTQRLQAATRVQGALIRVQLPFSGFLIR